MPLLEELTTRRAAEAFEECEVAVLPAGSTEQHGPALPLSTDFKAAEAVARAVADRPDTVVLPTLPVGISDHHRQFHGTLWVPPETFERYVADTLRSVTGHGIRKAVIVNGHGGNVGALRNVGKELYREETAFAVPWSWWEGVDDTPEEVLGEGVEVPGHAGGFESALMCHVAAALVEEERLEEAETGQGEPRWSDDAAPGGFDFVDVTGNGTKGEPTRASAEAGEALLDASAGALGDLIGWLADRPFEELRPRPHR
jgi:creatinine amidohydrolase